LRRCEEQGHAGQSASGRDHGERADGRAQCQPGQAQHDQRLDGTNRGRDPAGQTVGRHEEADPEHGEVQRTEHKGPAPPGARGQSAHEQQQEEPGGQGP
jgi:hypothetical protein